MCHSKKESSPEQHRYAQMLPPTEIKQCLKEKKTTGTLRTVHKVLRESIPGFNTLGYSPYWKYLGCWYILLHSCGSVLHILSGFCTVYTPSQYSQSLGLTYDRCLECNGHSTCQLHFRLLVPLTGNKAKQAEYYFLYSQHSQ